MTRLSNSIPIEILKKNMGEAAKEALQGCRHNEGGPFGAIIVDKNGNEISRGHNMVLVTNDPSAHAEIVAIRNAAKSLNTLDLSDFLLLASCEPCPMCLSAICEAKISDVIYGASGKDAADINFSDESIKEIMKKYSIEKPEVTGDWVRVKRRPNIRKEMAEKFSDSLQSMFGMQIEDMPEDIAIIVKDNIPVAIGIDQMNVKSDPTAHAAISAIQHATATWKNGFDLTGFDVYLSYTPCPLCFAAIHWARIRTVYCGAEPESVKGAEPSAVLATLRGDRNMSLIQRKQMERETCLVPFREWQSMVNRAMY